MRTVLICGLLVGAAGRAGADETMRLADVITVAVRQSPELERSRIELSSAQGRQLAASGIQDVHLGAAASFTEARDASLLVSRTQVAEASVGVSRLFSTGALVALSVGAARGIDTAAGTGAEQKYVTTSAAVSVKQPLLRGRGAGEVLAPVREASHVRDAAVLAREASARELVVSISTAYWRVALAARQLEVRKASLDLAEKQLAFTEGSIRSDKMAKSEALAVEQVIATRRQDVIAAEQLVLERSLELRELAGLEIGPDAIAVKTEALPTVQDITLDLPAIVQSVFAHNADLASLAALERAAQATVEGADGAARSRLDLELEAGPLATDRTLSGSFATSPGYSVFGRLTFDHAIQRRVERGRQGEARATLQRAKVELRATRNRLATRAVRAAQRTRAAIAVLAFAGKAITLAEQNIDAEQRRFELGKSTNFEVLRRQDELEQARLRHAAATVDYLIARAELDGLTGDNLKHHGIVVR